MTTRSAAGQHLDELLIARVITIEQVEHAVPLARALAAGGLRLPEITLRTDAGLERAAATTAEVPGAVMGSAPC